MSEIWKDCFFDARYKISNLGNLKRVLCNGEERTLKTSMLNKNKSHPYKYIQTNINKKRTNYLIHRLVATAFCEKSNEKYNIVDHIDRNTLNNESKNLRWGDQFLNMRNTSKYRADITDNEKETKKQQLDRESRQKAINSKKHYCSLCDIVFQGESHKKIHDNGRSHKLKLKCSEELKELFNKQNYLIWRNKKYEKFKKNVEYIQN